MSYAEIMMTELFGVDIEADLEFPTKDKGKAVARRKAMHSDKANRSLKVKAKPYVNVPTEMRKALKKQASKQRRKGKADGFIRISDMRYYDGLYHNSIYGVA